MTNGVPFTDEHFFRGRQNYAKVPHDLRFPELSTTEFDMLRVGDRRLLRFSINSFGISK